MLDTCIYTQRRRGSINFFKGWVEEENVERKMFKLIHVSTRVHIKTRQTCNSFSFLRFQEDCLLFFALCYYSLLILKFERGGGGCNPRSPPMHFV